MVLLLAEAIGMDATGGMAGCAGTVAILDDEERAPHETATLRFAAARIAALLGWRLDETAEAGADRYWLPMSTLSSGQAQALGIQDESRLWGGVVPAAFVATKLVSHPLWRRNAAAPTGWKNVRGIEGCTLPGYAVFTREDARAAAADLLRGGEIRLKCPFARGGHGQALIRNERELSQWLDSAEDGVVAGGMVVERHLVQSITYSVGSTSLPGYRIAYHGEQRNVVDRSGREAYGGSVLTVFPGSMAALYSALPEGELGSAVRAAMRYDSAVRARYGVLASRCNYDVIAGFDSGGQRHLGVLEQSWRFGGASMAEVLAIERFAERPGLPWVIAETVESYADDPLPADAVVYWRGDDALQSPRKYARIVRDGH